jgi:hypothetical protein
VPRLGERRLAALCDETRDRWYAPGFPRTTTRQRGASAARTVLQPSGNRRYAPGRPRRAPRQGGKQPGRKMRGSGPPARPGAQWRTTATAAQARRQRPALATPTWSDPPPRPRPAVPTRTRNHRHPPRFPRRTAPRRTSRQGATQRRRAAAAQWTPPPGGGPLANPHSQRRATASAAQARHRSREPALATRTHSAPPSSGRPPTGTLDQARSRPDRQPGRAPPPRP